jgi:hypothetical protein
MKKYILLYVVAALSIIMIFISGCKKVYDYIEIHPSADLKICPIQRFIFSMPYSHYIDTLNFNYNILGDPISITRPEPRTGAPNYLFKYDKAGRLTDFIGVYSSGIWTELWHRYFYDGQNRIVTDSVYEFAQMINGHMSNPNDSYVNLLTYDSKNRIIVETRIWHGQTQQFNYSYNAAGNKTPGIYDQKINYHRTNKIWMFVDREYSLNNPFQANSYNSFLLPEKIGLNISSYSLFLNNAFINATIEYMCSN